MRPSDPRPGHHRRQVLSNVIPKVGWVCFAVPFLAAASVVAVELVRRRGRDRHPAPRPGTFHAAAEDSQQSIYTDGAALYEDMIDAINAARDSVFMQAYIWKNDEVGQRFIDAFNAAAFRGVDVRIIYDGFANLVVPPSFYRQLSDEIGVFRLPVVGRKFWKGPLRYTGVSHSKILVVDDTTGFVGGYNIGALYAHQWRDTHLREVGPAAWGLRQAIARVWNEDRPSDEKIRWISPGSWNPGVRVKANLPVDLVYPIRHMYLEAIESAQDHIRLSTAYFIPDQRILRALVAAAERGVTVEVMMPKDSNHVLSDWVSRGFFSQMLDAGITLLLYTTSMMHSKTATIDGQWSTVGTANLDRLSLTFNYETNIEIIEPGFAAQMEKVFALDSEHCEVVDPHAWRERHPMARLAEAALMPLRPVL